MKNLLLLLFFFAGSTLAIGQNYLMDEGESGGHITGSYSSKSPITAYGVSPGYTWNGKLSLNLTYAYQTVSFSGVSLGSVNSLGPSLSYLINKQQGSSFPISVMALGSYAVSWTGDESASATNFGLGLFHTISASETIDLVPLLAANYTTVSNNGFSQSATIYQAGLTVQFGKFYIQPTFAFDADDSQFSLGAGFIF